MSDIPHTCLLWRKWFRAALLTWRNREEETVEILDFPAAAAAGLVVRSLCSCALHQLSRGFYANISDAAKIKCELGPVPSAWFRCMNSPPECEKDPRNRQKTRRMEDSCLFVQRWKFLIPVTIFQSCSKQSFGKSVGKQISEPFWFNWHVSCVHYSDMRYSETQCVIHARVNDTRHDKK